jgi:uncharacterized protein (TIGR02001 family)
MRKTILSLGLAAAVTIPGVASAQSTTAAAPSSPHTITGNLGLFSSYRFRGIDQTFGDPALQGGVDYSHTSGIYLGNWNSNVNEGAGYPGASLEMDFYGGWKKSFGDFGLDLGAIYYYYPGSDASATTAFSPTNNKTGQVAGGTVSNFEVYVGGSWKWFSLKYFYSVDDYFSTPDTDGSSYTDLGFSYDLGSGWGVNAHIGYLKFKNMTNGDYTDWKLGVTKDISGWVLGASYIDTNADGDCNNTSSPQPYCFFNSSGTKTKDAGRSMFVVSVTKSF